MATRHVCRCGRDAVDVVSVAIEDDVLLLPMCAECLETGDLGEQGDLFPPRVIRRPLSAMPSRDEDVQQQLPLDDGRAERGAA